MKTRLIVAVFGATLLVTAPGVVVAGKRDNARVAVAEARAKIDMNERNGITGAAADIQARARTALNKAEKEFSDSQENATIAAAKEANALADLAASTQKQQAAAGTEAAVAAPGGGY